MGSNSAPGFAKHPEHRIDMRRSSERVRVIFNGEAIADTREALRMQEASYAPVYYVPRKDVKMERLERTTHSSHCPFKGRASYFTISAGERTSANAVWSYETPYDEMKAIEGLLAFYPDRVDSISVEPA